MKDVARYTGLSIATISKYINGGNVLEENRVIIEKAIKDLNFRVNEIARGLKTNKTKTIGILIPDLKQLFCTTIVSNVENILLKHGYSTIICDYKEDPELESEKLQFLKNKMVDGVILMPLGGFESEENMIRDSIADGMAVVLIDRALKNVECDMVLVDNLNASYNAVEELIKRGHKRIGIISGPEDIYTAEERLKGYYRVHEDYSIPVDGNLIKRGDFKLDGGYRLFMELTNMEQPPTAIFITNYEMTLGAVIAINESDIAVPEDISIIGFDNLELARVVKPPLSLVIQPMEQIGEASADILLKRLNGDNSNYPVRFRLKSELLLKGSIRDI